MFELHKEPDLSSGGRSSFLRFVDSPDPENPWIVWDPSEGIHTFHPNYEEAKKHLTNALEQLEGVNNAEPLLRRFMISKLISYVDIEKSMSDVQPVRTGKVINLPMKLKMMTRVVIRELFGI